MSKSKEFAIPIADEDENRVVLPRTTLEGAGGPIRNTLYYSMLLDRSLRIENIQADRPGLGGLRVKHTVALGTMSKLSNTRVKGNTASRRTLIYSPYILYNTKREDDTRPEENLEFVQDGSTSI